MNDERQALRGGANPRPHRPKWIEAGYSRKPGPKPGQRHAGQWKPGESGNPSGRPRKGPAMKALEERCRESADEALAFLLDTIQDRDAPHNVRLAAAREILDRGYGKPVDRSAVLNLNTGNGQPFTLSNDELERIAAGAYDAPSGQVLEFTAKNSEEQGEDPPG